jgi:hypothetical protein
MSYTGSLLWPTCLLPAHGRLLRSIVVQNILLLLRRLLLLLGHGVAHHAREVCVIHLASRMCCRRRRVDRQDGWKPCVSRCSSLTMQKSVKRMVSDCALVGKDAVSRSETKRLSNGCGARVLRTSQSERVTTELEMPTMDAPPGSRRLSGGAPFVVKGILS